MWYVVISIRWLIIRCAVKGRWRWRLLRRWFSSKKQWWRTHMSLTGTLSVAAGSKLDVIVAGGGSAGGRCARRLGSTGGPATSSDYGDGGRSSIQTSGEDMLIAEGGEGGEEDSSSKKEKQIEEEEMKHRSLPNSDLISSHSSSNRSSSHSSSSSSSSSRSIFGTCNGQHSKFFDPSACGRGGSRTSQEGLVAIELLPLAAALGVTKLMDDANLSSPSASTYIPTSHVRLINCKTRESSVDDFYVSYSVPSRRSMRCGFLLLRTPSSV